MEELAPCGQLGFHPPAGQRSLGASAAATETGRLSLGKKLPIWRGRGWAGGEQSGPMIIPVEKFGSVAAPLPYLCRHPSCGEATGFRVMGHQSLAWVPTRPGLESTLARLYCSIGRESVVATMPLGPRPRSPAKGRDSGQAGAEENERSRFGNGDVGVPQACSVLKADVGDGFIIQIARRQS